MTTKLKSVNDLLAKGYILIPKQLLEIELAKIDAPMSNLEAILTLLTKVNYKNTLCTIHHQQMLCERGEALFSSETWADMFHWRRGKTRNFLKHLEKMGIIEYSSTPYNLRVRVSDYELWTGCRTTSFETRKTEIYELFEKFWDAYHLETNTRKRNRGKAERAWFALTDEERKLAIDNISNYYYSLKDITFCKQAATYLIDKAFLDE